MFNFEFCLYIILVVWMVINEGYNQVWFYNYNNFLVIVNGEVIVIIVVSKNFLGSKSCIGKNLCKIYCKYVSKEIEKLI